MTSDTGRSPRNSASDEYGLIMEFLDLTAGQLQARKYWEKTFTFRDFKRKCHDTIPAWYIRRNASEQVGHAGNGLTLVFPEIWSSEAAAKLDLTLVPLHEKYKPFITVTNTITSLSRVMISSYTILGMRLLIHDGIKVESMLVKGAP